VYPPYIITPLEGIQKQAGNSVSIQYSDGKNLTESQSICNDADVVIIVVGYTHKYEGEFILTKGGDRKILTLLPKDEKLIHAIATVNKKIIVIMEGGSAIITESWKDQVSSILMAWYPGMEGGTALADILFGLVNPSGKLPCIFPKSAEQLPFFDRNAKSIEYDYYHGYRLLDKNQQEPAFPFGYGLSYTKYIYNNLQISNLNPSKDDSIIVSVDVENIGDMDGEEIVQLYVGYEESKVDRPIKELKGFQRVKIVAKEKTTVSLKLNIKNTAYYDIHKKDWVVESIPCIIYVGSSSKDSDLLSKKIQIK
jgi:beta-glucosidase